VQLWLSCHYYLSAALACRTGPAAVIGPILLDGQRRPSPAFLGRRCAASGLHGESEHRTGRVTDDALGGVATEVIE
jgi:hypothetical protein